MSVEDKRLAAIAEKIMPRALSGRAWSALPPAEKVFASVYGALGIVEIDGLETVMDKGMDGDEDLTFLCQALEQIGESDGARELSALCAHIGPPVNCKSPVEFHRMVSCHRSEFDRTNRFFWTHRVRIDEKLLKFAEMSRLKNG